MFEDLLRTVDVGLEEVREAFGTAGQQRLGVVQHEGVLVAVDDLRGRYHALDDLVQVRFGGDARADVEELVDALRGEPAGGPLHELPVLPGRVTRLGRQLLAHRLIGGVVVLAAQQPVVHACRVGSAGVDPRRMGVPVVMTDSVARGGRCAVDLGSLAQQAAPEHGHLAAATRVHGLWRHKWRHLRVLPNSLHNDGTNGCERLPQPCRNFRGKRTPGSHRCRIHMFPASKLPCGSTTPRAHRRRMSELAGQQGVLRLFQVMGNGRHYLVPEPRPPTRK